MIVFAGIVPCSPLLLPSVNPERVGLVEKTRNAMKELAEELFATHPDTIVILCEHTQAPTDAFAMNVADPYIASLAAFGDLGYSQTYHSDFMLADKAQRELRKNGIAISMVTEAHLPFGATVPLEFLREHISSIRVLPIAPSSATPKAHFDFGVALRGVLLESHKRIAVIAAGDCSHTRTEDAPGGLHPEGKQSDDLLETLIAQRSSSGLLQFDSTLLQTAQDAAYRQIVMLFGILDGSPVESRVLSHEAPFGVGEIVAELVLN